MARVPELGELIADRYRIQAQTREGPGYVTLQAFDREVEVDVSLLWFRAGLFPSESTRRDFLGDAVTIRGLTHPHLRRVYEAHVYEENAFVTAQVGSAAAIVKRLGSGRPADELDVIRYATAICEGLESAHRLGLIHGYLVPSDIVEVSGQVKVTGVGLFRAASRDVARDLFWTRRRYLAPEVVDGGDADVRSDVYSMAAVLAEVASGSTGGDIATPLAAASEAHPRIRDVLERALSNAPHKRHASIGAVLDQIRRHLVDDRVPTAEQPALQRPLADPDTSKAIVIEAEEPPESMNRRPTTQRPIVTKKLLEDDGFDPNPISLLHADGDPMAVSFADPVLAADDIGPQDSSPWSRAETDDDEPDEITFARENNHVGDLTVEIDFQSKTREYKLEDSVPYDEDDVDDPPLELSPPAAQAPETLEKPFEPVQEVTRLEKPAPRPEPAPVRAPSVEIAAPPDPFAPAVDPSPATLRAMPPPASRPVARASGAPSTSAPPAAPTARDSGPADEPRFVSKMPPPPASPPTPLIPLVERPGAKPVLKPISSQAPRPAPQSLGRYAPPRAAEPAEPRSSARWLWAAAAVMAIVLGGLLAVILVRESNKDEGAQGPAIDAGRTVVAVVDAAPAKPDAFAGPCIAPMLHAEPEDEIAFCIDKFEASGADRMPIIEITLDDARAACQSRGARLCTSDEWVAGCRGKDKARYPYGRRYVRDACNASLSRRRTIEPGGNYPECESAVGAFDMSGNVGEWTAEGFVQGGSALDVSGGRCSKRYKGRATKAYKDVGYRCCADPLAVD